MLAAGSRRARPARIREAMPRTDAPRRLRASVRSGAGPSPGEPRRGRPSQHSAARSRPPLSTAAAIWGFVFACWIWVFSERALRLRHERQTPSPSRGRPCGSAWRRRRETRPRHSIALGLRWVRGRLDLPGAGLAGVVALRGVARAARTARFGSGVLVSVQVVLPGLGGRRAPSCRRSVNWPVVELKLLPCPAEVQRACTSAAHAGRVVGAGLDLLERGLLLRR